MLGLIDNFLEILDRESVEYVHWKSNTNIDHALSGIDDLDILVNPVYKHKVHNIFKDLAILRGYSEKDSWQNEIFHYFGMDVKKKELVHIHLHYLLEVGYDFDKNTNLPIVETYINNRVKYKNIYIPEVEKEYILLIIRLLLKNAFVPFLLMLPTAKFRYYNNCKKVGVVSGSAYCEFTDLKGRVDRDKLNLILADVFPFLSRESFLKYESVIDQNNSIFSYFSQAQKLKKEIKSFNNHNEVFSFLLSFYRINKGRINTALKNKRFFKKVPKNGGRIIAFVGGDGAGKSTNVDKLRKILIRHFHTDVIHIGRPKKHIIGTILRVVSKLSRISKCTNFASAIGYLALANDRKQAFLSALKVRRKGGIALLDRIPLEGITSMDCPRIHTIENGRYKWFSTLERKMYANISGGDELIALKLNPEIALLRRPEDDADELLIRSGQIWEKDFSKIDNAHVIDTSNSFDYVEEAILSIVWQSIRKKTEIYEILGLAGSGKSTMKSALNLKYRDCQFEINATHKNKGIYLIRKIPITFYIFYKTRDLMFVKAYLYLQTILNTFSNSRIEKNGKIIFDQGSIYIVCILIKEIPSLEVYLLKDLKKILQHYDEIIYLEAPSEVLANRINTRKDEHRIKNVNSEKQLKFLEGYRVIYKNILNICHEEGFNLTIIDSNNNDVSTVERLIIDVIEK